jgi:hypothetical protein
MKTFKHFIKEMNTSSGIAGLPPDDPPVNVFPVSSPVIIGRQNLKKKLKLKYRMKAANK